MNEASRLDWVEAARHLLASVRIVRRARVFVLVKFDGERTNGKIYTILVDGNSDDASTFRADTRDLQSALSTAFPLDGYEDEDEAQSIAPMLAHWGRWVRLGFVLVLQIFYRDESLLYSVSISNKPAGFDGVRAEGDSLLQVMADSAKQTVEWFKG